MSKQLDEQVLGFSSVGRLQKLAGIPGGYTQIDETAELDEDDVTEGNEFAKALADARKKGDKEFKVGDKTYQVKEYASKKAKGKKELEENYEDMADPDMSQDFEAGDDADEAMPMGSEDELVGMADLPPETDGVDGMVPADLDIPADDMDPEMDDDMGMVDMEVPMDDMGADMDMVEPMPVVDPVPMGDMGVVGDVRMEMETALDDLLAKAPDLKIMDFKDVLHRAEETVAQIRAMGGQYLKEGTVGKRNGRKTLREAARTAGGFRAALFEANTKRTK